MIQQKREVDLAYSKEEARVNDALWAALAAPRALYQQAPALGPAPRYGIARHVPDASSVLSTGRHPGPDNRMDYSGSYGAYSGTSRPGLGHL